MLSIIATLTHNPYWYIFMDRVAVMQHNPKRAFLTNSSFDKSTGGSVAQGCHVTGLFCCLALNILSGLNIGKSCIIVFVLSINIYST